MPPKRPPPVQTGDNPLLRVLYTQLNRVRVELQAINQRISQLGQNVPDGLLQERKELLIRRANLSSQIYRLSRRKPEKLTFIN